MESLRGLVSAFYRLFEVESICCKQKNDISNPNVLYSYMYRSEILRMFNDVVRECVSAFLVWCRQISKAE